MRVIELECPSCEMELEVDSGFAGGVCRCSQCGTLMTVPADPDLEQAEELHIADRPTVPSGTGTLAALTAEPDEDEEVLEYAESDMGLSPLEATAIRPDSPVAPAAAAPAEGVQVYTTASGRTIEIHRHSPVAIARKRKIVRAATYAVFGVVAFLMLAVAGVIVGVLIYTMDRPIGDHAGPETTPPVVITDTFRFDPLANPLLLDKPNILGLPLHRPAVVVLDRSAGDALWLKQVERMLANAEKQALQASSAPPDAAPPVPPLEIRRVADRDKLTDTVTVALRNPPKQLVIILGHQPSADASGRIIAAVRRAKGCETSIFMVDDEDLELFDAARATGGQGRMLGTLRLQTWTDQAEQ